MSRAATLQSKSVVLFSGTIATDATASAIVDRLGFDYAKFRLLMRPATATNSSAKWTSLKVKHGDTTAISDAVAVSGLIGTTNATAATTVSAKEFVIPANNNTTIFGTTAQNGGGQQINLNLDLRGRGRYLFLEIQANASHQTAFATCDLFKGEDMPLAAADQNAGAVAYA